eukprot:TRINITY_DN13243_c0_g1_i1.p1 TRINITY_DN13243_c0_g1~~TRINITY_DN13243_c0_g1_i1.p1  ORF type:complete len:275 (-),score=36.01 TRINITY_DN13243_c0_g1_i1:38-862(-)
MDTAQFQKVVIEEASIIKTHFCSIHYGRYNKESVAIKEQEFGQANLDADFIQILKEIAILAQCNHTRIIQIKGIYFSPNKLQISIILPRYYKDLYNILFVKKTNLPNTKKICQQIIEAIDYIHNKGFIHLDLKPSNIIFKDESLQNICLLDFGISKIQNDGTQSTDVLGLSYFYCPPEISQTEKSKISKKSDIFSLGIVLYEVITRTRAWINYINQGGFAIYSLIHSQNYNFFDENKSTGNNALDQLINNCVNHEPKKRPTAAEALKIIKEIDF